MARPIFGAFHIVLAQNPSLAQKYYRLGAPQVKIAGNLKFDSSPLPLEREKLDELRAAQGGRRVFLAASTHKVEEEMIVRAHGEMRERMGDLLTIIVPRHPERGDEIAALLKRRGVGFARRSKGETPEKRHEIYFADTLGEMAVFYSLAPVIFIGGSLVEDIGGHNPLEALQFGAVVLTGPHFRSQADIYEALLAGGGALAVKGYEELGEMAADLLDDEERRAAIRAKARRVMDDMSGALDMTMRALGEILEMNGILK
jgi:3-deoxy-D-manno-octulosonic-acid transferase